MKLNNPVSVRRDFTLTFHEAYLACIRLNKEYPKVVEAIVRAGNKIGCPFPEECNRFPCEDMRCNADVCSNGYAYRMS